MIELRPRHDTTDVAGHDHAGPDPDETGPNLPAVVEPDEVLPAEPDHPRRPVKRLQRPAWAGLTADHRAAARAASWQVTKNAGGRVAFEACKGMPTRGWRVARWFVRGMRGWVVLLAWIFATAERADLRDQRKQDQKPGRSANVGRHADRLAWWRAGVVVVPHVVGWAVLRAYYPDLQLLVFVPAVVATVVHGWWHDPKPAAPVAAPRRRESVEVESMNAALRAVDILDQPTTARPNPEGVRLAAYPHRVGAGEESRWDLPASCGKSAVDVVKVRDRLAGAFATPRDRFLVEVGDHESQIVVWQASTDPFGGPLVEHPLLDEPCWDVWTPAPFARDTRGRTVTMPLVFTSLLVGARPRRGKSLAARAALAGAVLDPHVRFHLFDGKGGATWEALAPVAAQHVEGCDDGEVADVAARLEDLVADMRARAKRVPKSKITPEAARDPHIDAPVTVVVVDEAQEYLSHPGHGKRVERALTTLAKVGPSSGYCLVVITQRPDADSFPSGLRAVLGARLGLQVMSWQDSNVILGPDMSKLGHDASKITKRGVGLLRPDDDANGEPDEDTAVRMVRMFDASDEPWEAICARGAELRAQAAEAEPVEADLGDEQLPAAALYTRIRRAAPGAMPDGVGDARDLGAWLSEQGVRTQARKVAGQRVRSRLSVETALGLDTGCLADCPEAARPTGTDHARAVPRQSPDSRPGSAVGSGEEE